MNKQSLFYKTLTWVLGATITIFTSWFFTLGLYKIGFWISEDILQWNLVRYSDHIIPIWLTGMGVIVVPIAFFFLSKCVGKGVASYWTK